MYEALTGKPPFADENPIKTILKHLTELPRAMRKQFPNLEIPAGLDTIVRRCLEKNQDDRYQSMTALRKDLELVRDGKAPGKQKFSKKHQIQSLARVSRWGLGTITLIFLVLILIALFGSGDSNPFSDAQSLDGKSYYYYTHGQYDKAAPLLEFGVPTYKERVAQDLARGDTKAALQDQNLLAENWQHIGKCHLMEAKKASSANDKATAREELAKALHAYQQAMPFYYEHGGIWPRSLTPEAVQGYAEVLTDLNMTRELSQLKSFAAKWHISI